jgi:hypothetical protein
MTSAVASVLMHSSRTNPMGAFFTGPILGFGLLIGLVGIIAGWKVFEKAGQPGWAIIIPIFNAYIILYRLFDPCLRQCSLRGAGGGDAAGSNGRGSIACY